MRFDYLGSHARFSIRVEARSTLRMSGTCIRRPESLRNKSAYERARPSHRACVRVDQWNVPHNSLGCIESIRTSIPRSPRFRLSLTPACQESFFAAKPAMPISWSPALMRNRCDEYVIRLHAIMQSVGETIENETTFASHAARPPHRRFRDAA